MKKKTKEQTNNDILIAERLRVFRMRNKISHVDIGKLLKLNASTIVSFEKGKTTIKPEYLDMIIEQYNLPSDFFLVKKINNEHDNSQIINNAGDEIEPNEMERSYKHLSNEERIDILLTQNNKLISILETQVSTINNLSTKVNDKNDESKNLKSKAS